MSKIIINVDPDLEDLVPAYFENRKLELASLKSSFISQNWAEIQNIGHKLKGNAASYGFETLTELGAFLEIAAKEKNQSQMKDLISQIEVYLSNVELKFPS